MSGIASRRAAEDVVRAGEVRVNGKVVESLSTQVDPERDIVTVGGKSVTPAEHLVYLLLNKPKDYITTAKDEKDRRTVFDLLSVRERVFPIGRLDRNTTGVLLFTNDGFLATKLMHPSSEVKKEYHVSIDQSLDEAHREKLSKGIFLDDGKTAPADIIPVPGTKNREIIVTIHEGRNRQVRRMFEALGYEVERLHRISYGGLTAEGVGRGKWRFLTDQEVRKLKSLVGQSDRKTGPEGKKSHTARKTASGFKQPQSDRKTSSAWKKTAQSDRKTSPAGKKPQSDRKTSPAGKRAPSARRGKN
ncbi:MAG: pseudouridine synthase [Acidobacteriota bacterium]